MATGFIFLSTSAAYDASYPRPRLLLYSPPERQRATRYWQYAKEHRRLDAEFMLKFLPRNTSARMGDYLFRYATIHAGSFTLLDALQRYARKYDTGLYQTKIIAQKMYFSFRLHTSINANGHFKSRDECQISVMHRLADTYSRYIIFMKVTTPQAGMLPPCNTFLLRNIITFS